MGQFAEITINDSRHLSFVILKCPKSVPYRNFKRGETYEKPSKLAEGVGFEPTVHLRAQRFSRPPHSTALASLRTRSSYWRMSKGSRKEFWCRMGDSNSRPTDYKSVALPAELIRHNLGYIPYRGRKAK